MNNVVLITTSSFGKEDSSPLKVLRDAGYEVILNPYGRKLTEDEVSTLLAKASPIGMIAGVEPLTAAVIQKVNGLKVISRCGIGMESVDLEAAKNCGIAVTNTPDGPTQAVAELTVGLILAALRKIVVVDASLRAGEWKRPMGNLLGKQTVGIIGCGRIGSAVARLIKPFGSKIIGYDPGINNHPSIELVSLETLLKKSDIVSLHIPYTESTANLVDKDFLAKMKRGSLLVNASRGGLVDENELYKSIADGHLAGACIDTFADEPYTGLLTRLDQVVITAHIGSYAKEARIDMEMQAALNLIAALEGKKS